MKFVQQRKKTVLFQGTSTPCDGFVVSVVILHTWVFPQQCSSQSPLKKLFGLRRSGQSKHNITPVGFHLEARTNCVTNTGVVIKSIAGLFHTGTTS